jgi:hypothetical protein
MNQMNWYVAERVGRERVQDAERAARHYPHVAHLLEQERMRRPINEARIAVSRLFGRLLAPWRNQVREHTTVEGIPCADVR